MSYSEATKSITALAGSDFTGDTYKLVKVSAAKTVDLATAATDVVVGVIAEAVTSGEDVAIMELTGIVPVLVGGNISAGNTLVATAGGKVIAKTLATLADGEMSVGVAWADGVDGDVIPMLAQPMFRSNDAA